MNTLIFSFLLIITTFAAYADEMNMPSGSSAMKDAYTGKAPDKVSTEIPEELIGVGITEKIGDTLDLSLVLTNEKGEKRPLSTYFHSHKPVILSPVYFNCPGLCNFHLNGLIEGLQKVDWSPAKEFEILAVSFDWNETSEVALKKKQNYLKSYGRVGTDDGWHFLTGDETTIKKITQTVGFNYKWNEQAKEWSHASAAIMISPEGKISRYLHGIMFEPRDLKLALNEASNGKVGGIVDSAMLFCFKYDSHQSKYGLQVFQLMKIAGALTAAALALWLGAAMIQAKRENT